jgi:hypothetical protein
LNDHDLDIKSACYVVALDKALLGHRYMKGSWSEGPFCGEQAVWSDEYQEYGTWALGNDGQYVWYPSQVGLSSFILSADIYIMHYFMRLVGD